MLFGWKWYFWFLIGTIVISLGLVARQAAQPTL